MTERRTGPSTAVIAVGVVATLALVLALWAVLRGDDNDSTAGAPAPDTIESTDEEADPDTIASTDEETDREEPSDGVLPATPAAPTLPPLPTPTPEPTVLVATDDLTDGVDFEIEVATSLFANPSAEGAEPAGWNSDAFGDIDATFTHLDGGNSGTRSLGIEVTSHTSGDAKWFPDPVAVESGGFYEFSSHYRADVETEVWLVRYDGQGAPAFDLLEVLPRSSDWRRFGTEFLVPEGTEAATVFHVLKAVGTLGIDDYALGRVDEPLGFERGIVSITFDDTWTNDGRTLLTLAEHGFVVDLFVATDIVAEQTEGGVEQVREFLAAGHGLGSHSLSHRDLTTLTTAELETELVDSALVIADTFERDATAFASPFGIYNTPVLDLIARHYDLHRTTNAGFNTPTNLDPLRIKVQNVRDTTTTDQVTAWTEAARDRGWWLVLVYHDVTESPGPFDTTPDEFASQMRAVADTGIAVIPLADAWAELESQLG